MNAATALGSVKGLGALEQGELAGLVILDANPLDDNQHTDDIDSVMLNGRLFDAEFLNETGARARKRRHWEGGATTIACAAMQKVTDRPDFLPAT